jgi:hypothetical protein
MGSMNDTGAKNWQLPEFLLENPPVGYVVIASRHDDKQRIETSAITVFTRTFPEAVDHVLNTRLPAQVFIEGIDPETDEPIRDAWDTFVIEAQWYDSPGTRLARCHWYAHAQRWEWHFSYTARKPGDVDTRPLGDLNKAYSDRVNVLLEERRNKEVALQKHYDSLLKQEETAYLKRRAELERQLIAEAENRALQAAQDEKRG